MSLFIVQRVVERCKAAAEQLVVLTEEDFESLSAEEQRQWKGYTYKMAYEVVTPESAEEGDAEDRGWEEEGSQIYDYLEELLKAVDDHSWMEWSSSSPDGKHDWLVSQGEVSFRTGAETSYHLWIERKDGRPLSRHEMAFIERALHVR
jgi:hypothetical protein